MAPAADPAGAFAPPPFPPAPRAREPLESLTALQARRHVLATAGTLPGAEVPLAAALGRVLARDLEAPGDSPPADLSAVDGYAIADVAPPARGRRFGLIGEAAAGCPFAGDLGPGECVRIFTGAPLPRGASRVLLQENVEPDANAIRVERDDGAPRVRARGENHRAGQRILSRGTRLGPLELALAASVGIAAVPIHRAPRVAHLVTGTELVPAGASAPAGQIHDANSPLIAALAAACGVELVAQQLLPDDFVRLEAAARALPEHDVLLISGGAGHGRYDFAAPLLERLGFTLHFRSVSIRPGKPLAFATAARRLAFALPGNPVSHWATWQLFVAPVLRRLAGESVVAEPVRVAGTLATEWQLGAEEREVFWPAHVTPAGATWRVQPRRFLNSGDLAGVAGANALLTAAVGSARRLAAGDRVEFLLCP